ncbi:integrase [Klebsiella pneumoniae]|nr:integrase [Klebsiella pneumoniae]
MGSCAAPSAKGDDKFITTDYLQQCLSGVVVPKGGLSSAMFFYSKKRLRPNEGLSERAELFTINNFKGLQHADWLCTRLYRGSKS